MVALSLAGTQHLAQAAGPWWNSAWGLRLTVTVGAGGVSRDERPAEADIDFGFLVGTNGGGTFDPTTIRVLEVDGSGNVVGQPVAHQYDGGATGVGHLTWMMPGSTAASATRTFHVYFERSGSGIGAAAVTPLVHLTRDGIVDSGLSAYRIESQLGTWYYDRNGAAFSSLVAPDGKDWIGWEPTAPASYTGIPNLTDDWFHPAGTKARSTVAIDGPLRVVLDGESSDGQWAIRTEIFPRYARSTVNRKAANGYWFQYEGIPGGGANLDTAFSLRPGGGGLVQAPLAQNWDTELAGEEWAAWGVPAQGRSLFMAHHQDDGSADSHTLMFGNTVVFAYGRGNAGWISEVPHQFTYGLLNTVDQNSIAASTRSAYRDLSVQVGGVELRTGGGGTTTTTTTTTTGSTTTTTQPGTPGDWYTGVSPVRIMDTRYTVPAPTPMSGRVARSLTVRGANGVPADATAAVMNVTVVNATQPSWLTVSPSTGAVAGTSNVNFANGAPTPNLVTVPLGADGGIRLTLDSGLANVIVDLVGWYRPGSPSGSGGYHPISPIRALDTRLGTPAPLGPNETRPLDVASPIGVSPAGLRSVALNVTATGGSAESFLTVHPAGTPVPDASNLNWLARQTVPNADIATTDVNGRIALTNKYGTVHVVVDVVGWYDDGFASGLRFHPVAPTRLTDTRNAPVSPLVGGAPRTFALAGGVVPAQAQAVAANLTLDVPNAETWVRLYPTGAPLPISSTQNVVAGQTRANFALVGLGSGAVTARNETGQVHLILDVFGWFG